MAISEEFKQQLTAVSGQIADFILQAEKQEDKLVFIDKLLNELIYNLRFSRLKTVEHIQSPDENSTSWQDGMLIINAATEIIKNTGFQNHLLNSLNSTHKFKFIDFIDEADQESFRQALDQAIGQRKNIKVEVRLKTGIVDLNRCLIQFDLLTSNVDNDRLVVYYTFIDHFNMQTFDFQTFVFDNLPGMDLYMFDKDYRYILVGGREKYRNNFSNSDFVGKKLFEIVDEKTQRKFFPFYNKAINGEYTEGEVRYQNDIYYLFAAPIKNHENKTVAGIIIAQNVTKDKILEENLIKNKEQAQKANQAKSIFLANMSHEIRTPLNSILGFTEQLNKTQLSKEQEELVRLINSSSDHLLYLVNEIVFLFKLGMDKVYIEKINFSLHDLLFEINNDCRKQAREKNLAFMFDLDDDIPELVKGDPFRLRQILMNLLVNALKYTKEGHIKFSAKLISNSKKITEIHFEIEDSGIGISKKDLPFIFDVFEQGNKRTEMIRGGAGLGLGICKRLVELLKGEIQVKSKLRVGSTFSIQIPFEKASSIKPKATQVKYELSDKLLAGKKILLADDDDHNLLLAEMMLKEWEADFMLVKDGKEALEALKKHSFDMALLDINMPHKSGVQVVKALKSSAKGVNNNIPFVALTANAIKSDLIAFMKAGFDSYIIKPIKEAELYNILCNILKINAVNDHQKPPKETQQAEITADTFDTTDLINAAKGDGAFFNKMIGNFIVNSHQLLDDINNNMAENNWGQVGQRAHKAITSFRFFKLNNIAALLMQIEELALHHNDYKPIPALFEALKDNALKAIEQAESAIQNSKINN